MAKIFLATALSGIPKTSAMKIPGISRGNLSPPGVAGGCVLKPVFAVYGGLGWLGVTEGH